ncbi:MAG: glycosyltransferase family 4 protein [Acidobacteria bacterium]|nr:glycosyltransferase family 4 protein [Acidobacteriota bacterium]
MRQNEDVRVAWFSPLPPDPSGIAAYSAEVVPLLHDRVGAIDLYSESGHRAAGHRGAPVFSPHDFVWRHRRRPYDLIVYQLGNATAHDFMWGYLFRYPGLVVLHDAQVHQARALGLLRRAEPRLADYLAEVQANHPDAPADIGFLVAAGLGGGLFRLWPLVSLVLRTARMAAVHSPWLASALAGAHPDAAIRAIPMGVADPLHGLDRAAARAGVRARHGIPAEAVVIGAYGGVTPEKRVPQLLAVLASRLVDVPVHVLLVGQRAGHYDVDADIERLGLQNRVHVTGFVADEDLPAYLTAADIAWCLRWPSNGETSASWIRCLGAGLPTLTTALAQMSDVPTVPAVAAAAETSTAVGLAIDVVNEIEEIEMAVRDLAMNDERRARLGANARRWWTGRHTLEHMANGYVALLHEALTRPAPAVALPSHITDDGSGTARRILEACGLPSVPD